ncbi:OsmC family protein [Roseivirga misakiensis]|uniref:Peroxiredoxin n=1 Tax=Roseivirga misakiensis TaxID=1563681 RepID=A0A1E5T0T9_9BACT|nr:OsmC family protein [Roseivirga misakiensis]OEK04965.1 peroxiredoxin [Roseivirga misakiensis]
MKEHHYQIGLEWTGNKGNGTKDYKSYSRNHSITVSGKYDEILGSSDPSFRGDRDRYNPEELFLSSLSSCHMLWFLHLCATNGINVRSYKDSATGVMEEATNGSGRFRSVTLYPSVIIDQSDKIDKALSLHEEASKMCFIANSCNFKINHTPKVTSE